MLLYSMLMRGPLLILLIPVLSLCGATEYFVKPTEPTSTPCPARPCLTLNHYVRYSHRYFQSNTVFKFLPGTHHVDRRLHIGNVQNMSLEGYSNNSEVPLLMVQFPCDCDSIAGDDWLHVQREEVLWIRCAVIQLHDLKNVTVKDISITHETLCMSGVVFQYVSNITIQSVTISSSIQPREMDLKIGILIHNANLVEVYSSYVTNHSYGFFLQYVNNTCINSITAIYNGNFWTNRIYGRGINLEHIVNTTITSPTAEYSIDGMYFHDATNTTIIDARAHLNDMDGMIFDHTVNTTIRDVIVMDNALAGIVFQHATNTAIISAGVKHNMDSGMVLQNSTNTSIINPIAIYNAMDGITLIQSTSTDIIDATLEYNMNSGISISQSTDTCIVNVSTFAVPGFEIPIIRERCFIFIVSSSNTRIYNSSFTDITVTSNGASSVDPTSLRAVIVLYYSSMHMSWCNFAGNSVSAVKAYASNITTHDDLVVSSNRVNAGSAFILVQKSVLKLAENSRLYFSDNHATNTGGVFYITDNVYYETQPDDVSFHDHYVPGPPLPRSTCFLNTEDHRSQVLLTFVNNSAGKGGDILYGGQVAYGLDGDWNCLQSFKNVSNLSEDSLSRITSDPSRVCLCNETGKHDCLVLEDPTPHSVYPGQSLVMSAVVVGQDFGTVDGSVHAQFLPRPATDGSPQLGTQQGIQSVTRENCNPLKFTIFSKEEVSDAVLVLTATDEVVSRYVISFMSHWEKRLWTSFYHTSALDPLKYIHHPVYAHISILPCPTGFRLTTDLPFGCECAPLLQSLHGVVCHIQDQTIGRRGLVWVGTLMDDNETLVASEYCLFGYCHEEDSNVTLNDTDSQCNYNHSGTLCGGCQSGLSLALGSAQCLQCSNKYLALLIPFALAGPAVVFFIKLLDLTISQGTINGLIFYANLVKANEYILMPQEQTNPLTLFIAWLNLDLGVETCFFDGLTAYTKTWLQFVFPLYILTIAGLIIIFAKYSDRVAKLMGNNSVPVLATLFLLSYAKLFRTIITALSYTMLYSSKGHKAVWSADGNVDYLGPKHAPLFAVAVAALLFLWLPYTLLLFFGQWLHKCNCQMIEHVLMKIKPFLDAHYGPLKGKHHYWFGSLLLVRAIVLLMSALIPTNHATVVTFSISVFAIVLNNFGLVVYRSIVVALYDISFFMNLALLGVTSFFITSVSGNQATATYTLIGVAFVQFLGLVVFKVFSIFKKSTGFMACFRRGQPAEDDWELYEQAALQREMESDQEEEHSEESSSTDSLPTY